MLPAIKHTKYKAAVPSCSNAGMTPGRGSFAHGRLSLFGRTKCCVALGENSCQGKQAVVLCLMVVERQITSMLSSVCFLPKQFNAKRCILPQMCLFENFQPALMQIATVPAAGLQEAMQRCRRIPPAPARTRRSRGQECSWKLGAGSTSHSCPAKWCWAWDGIHLPHPMAVTECNHALALHARRTSGVHGAGQTGS